MSSNSTKPIVVVVGATGSQGGSVARFLLADRSFAVRACTRDTSSPSAKALADKGAQLVPFDWYNTSLIQSAFEGAYGVFAVTDFWRVGFDKEIEHGKAMADIAKAAGIKHFIWSTLDHSSVPHFESKARVDDYLKSTGLPHTSIYTSAFVENFLTLMALKKESDGTYIVDVLAPTDAPGLWMTVEDLGGWVLPALKDPQTWIGKDMKVVGDYISARQIAQKMSEVSGKTVKPVERSKDEFYALEGKLGGMGDEMWRNFEYLTAHDARKLRDLDLSYRLYPGTQDVKTWTKAHVDALFK